MAKKYKYEYGISSCLNPYNLYDPLDAYMFMKDLENYVEISNYKDLSFWYSMLMSFINQNDTDMITLRYILIKMRKLLVTKYKFAHETRYLSEGMVYLFVKDNS